MLSSLQMSSDIQIRNQLGVIDKFLEAFNKFIIYPRIHEVFGEKIVEKTVEKDRIVKVPVDSSEDQRRSLASAVLIDKLVL